MIRILLIGFTLLLAACNSDVLLSERWEWKELAWAVGDTKQVTLEAVDTTTVYRMDLTIEHTDTYAWQNLYVRTLTRFPSGKEVTSVTSLELSQPGGVWAGDCGGSTCRITLPLQQRFTFPETGTFTWSIEPYMRTDTVAGIQSLTVTCTRVKE